LFSVVIHEVAHGWTAYRLGDTTAYDMGRLTLNPIPHIDLIGSIVVPLISYFTIGSVFLAWAKPVPINPNNFRHGQRDQVLVSLMGPLSNFLVAACCTGAYIVLIRFALPIVLTGGAVEQTLVAFLIQMFGAGIMLNIFLAVFNLIPIPPLDGSHVFSAFLPEKLRQQYYQIGFAGIILVLVLMRLNPFRNAVITVVQVLSIPYQLLIHRFVP
jgi:Zn-dependent protease